MINEDEKYTAAKLKELSARSHGRGIWTYSGFLTLAEQSMVHTVVSGDYSLFGGYEAAERKIAVFGSEFLCGYIAEAPVCAVKIEPVSKKFSDKLTHRDYLGALMSLGIKRGTLGDIVVREDAAYLYCLESISQYICDNLIQIKHTTVRCTVAEMVPEINADDPDPESFVTASERLDAVIAAVYKIPRSESKAFIEQGRVFIDSRICMSPASQVNEDSIISVRGKGRFKYLGIARQTKKGKLSISAVVF